ncbi:MAG: hypothetical protein A2277_05405 [Desulfobacterales bacterium RIFOXYA12_FULL_46_15]|nr:MAG: hypothetical protein A2097_13920 [Desulfobacula sp. GWF2_41_7]OGR25821.1 MAG: hypothetical protein A2277_05405 [Desulfobacterales bacterium RIFOXYA12_FULL_46_15]
MKKQRNVVVLFLFVLCGTVFFSFSGCGKKGPPVLPVIKGYKIAPPIDFKLSENENEIELTWNHKIDEKEAYIQPDGFDIFLAKKTFDACQGCPFEFQKIGSVALPAMRFVMGIEKGYKYYFRIQAKGKDNLVSEFTKTVLFENR